MTCSVVAAACLGKNYCQVWANTSVFGDPCPGTAKTLFFSWNCTKRVQVPADTACPYAVSGEFHRCSTSTSIFAAVVEGGVMKVRFFANWDAYMANHQGIGGTDGARDLVSDNADNCSKSSKCPAGDTITDVIGFFKNAKVQSTGPGAYASCVSGTFIDSITSATYGCANGAAAAGALAVVQSACLNKTSCTVPANSTLFGDPCPGTAKTLTFSWTCASLPAPLPFLLP